jgi:hypothetical protein
MEIWHRWIFCCHSKVSEIGTLVERAKLYLPSLIGVRLLGRCNKSSATDIGPLRNVDEVICIGFDVMFDFSSFTFQHGCGVVYSLYVHEQLRLSGMLCQLGSSENCRTKWETISSRLLCFASKLLL